MPVLHRVAWVADLGGSLQVVLQVVSVASWDELLLALRGLQQHDGTMLVGLPCLSFIAWLGLLIRVARHRWFCKW